MATDNITNPKQKVQFWRGKELKTNPDGSTSTNGEIIFLNNTMSETSAPVGTDADAWVIDKKLGSIYQDDKIVGTTKAKELCLDEDIKITKNGASFGGKTFGQTLKKGDSLLDLLKAMLQEKYYPTYYDESCSVADANFNYYNTPAINGTGTSAQSTTKYVLVGSGSYDISVPSANTAWETAINTSWNANKNSFYKNLPQNADNLTVSYSGGYFCNGNSSTPEVSTSYTKTDTVQNVAVDGNAISTSKFGTFGMTLTSAKSASLTVSTSKVSNTFTSTATFSYTPNSVTDAPIIKRTVNYPTVDGEYLSIIEIAKSLKDSDNDEVPSDKINNKDSYPGSLQEEVGEYAFNDNGNDVKPSTKTFTHTISLQPVTPLYISNISAGLTESYTNVGTNQINLTNGSSDTYNGIMGITGTSYTHTTPSLTAMGVIGGWTEDANVELKIKVYNKFNLTSCKTTASAGDKSDNAQNHTIPNPTTDGAYKVYTLTCKRQSRNLSEDATLNCVLTFTAE